MLMTEYVYIHICMYIMASLLIGKWWLVHEMYILKVVIFLFLFLCVLKDTQVSWCFTPSQPVQLYQGD